MIDLHIHAEHGIATLTDPDDPDGMPAAEGYGKTNRAAISALIDKIDIPDEPAPWENNHFHVDFAGSRFWVEEEGRLHAAPILVDGTVEWESAGEVEAMAPDVAASLVATLRLLEADSPRW